VINFSCVSYVSQHKQVHASTQIYHMCNIFFDLIIMQKKNSHNQHVATPFWAKCEDETHTPKVGDLESSRTPATLELDIRRQNTSVWGVPYTVGKVLKCRCPKWPRMSHLDICSPSYGQKKGRESNWQFDSWPLKVENRPLPDVCRWSAMGHWKALEENYNFGSDLTPIGGRSQELWVSKVPGVQPGTVSGLLFGSLEKMCHLDVAPAGSCREFYMGEGGSFPWVQAVVSQVC
jgi:hypothetical protein